MFSNFHDWTSKGLKIIPVRGKIPAVPWIEFRDRLPTENELQNWQDNLDRGYYSGIGLILGEANGLIALDYDCLNSYPEIEKLIPKSVVIRIGREPKWLCVYKFTEAFKKKRKIFLPNGDAIEMLTEGQFMVAEGMHPITGKDYYYPNVHLLEAKKLPEFPEDAWDDIERHAAKLMESLPEKEKQSYDNGGRHYELIRIAGEAIYNDKPDEEIIEKLLEADKNFSESYFQTHKNTPEKMIASIRKTHERKIEKEKKILATEREVEVKKEEAKVLTPQPEPRGKLKDFITAANSYYHFSNSEIPLAYAMAYISMHLGNRFCLTYRGSLWPANLMIFVIADSGMGKNKPRKLMEQLLYGNGILGSSEYTSAVAILNEFKTEFKVQRGKNDKPEVSRFGKRELLASIDEVDGMLEAMAKGKDAFEKRFKKVLIELFDASRDQFLGQFSKGSGSEGRVMNPFFTFIGSTQPKYFKRAVRGDILFKGIFQRALFFEAKELGRPDFSKLPNLDLEQTLIDFTKSWYESHPVALSVPREKIAEGKENDIPVNYSEIRLSPGAENRLKDIEQELALMQMEAHAAGNGQKSSVIVRMKDNIIKIAQVIWLSDLPEKFLATPWCYLLDISHIEWARQFIFSKYESSLEYFNEGVYTDNRDESDMERILAVLRSNGGEATATQIKNAKIGLAPRRKQLLDELIERGEIEHLEDRSADKPKNIYKLLRLKK